MDNNPKEKPSNVVGILTWKYQDMFPVGHFDIIFACPPCEQVSQARTTAPRDVALAERIVERTLEIIRYFDPKRWFLENPRGGGMKWFECLKDVPCVDVDYCQFSDWGYQKPTRIWGGEHIWDVESQVCDRKTCPNLMSGNTKGKIGSHWEGI